jgi:B12-binding domain/radical SAM domain protein of rhizo-twelve system
VRYALINPNWSFAGSIYFGCREPHLPLEFGYAKALLEQNGHDAVIVDGQLEDLSIDDIRSRVHSFAPDFIVVCTAPSYLFWRCAPPELRVPQEVLRAFDGYPARKIGVGPHGSTTPRAALRKLGADLVVLGECEEVLPQLAGPWQQVESVCYNIGGEPWVQGSTHASDMSALGAVRWDADLVSRHRHHHHRFDGAPLGPGAEVETSRGCPYTCTFCAKQNFRDKYRRRPVPVVLEEVDGLLDQGVEYIYFIDEIFLPNKELLESLAQRKLKLGIQTRIDLWNEAMIGLLAKAGCVSIEAGVESITPEGRDLLDKRCRMSTDDLANRLIFAKQFVSFVQANLIEVEADDLDEVERFRERLQEHGVWANRPVPLYPYPGSPDYVLRWGQPDDKAWERATDYYLRIYSEFSDIQDARPKPLHELELAPAECR